MEGKQEEEVVLVRSKPRDKFYNSSAITTISQNKIKVGRNVRGHLYNIITNSKCWTQSNPLPTKSSIILECSQPRDTA